MTSSSAELRSGLSEHEVAARLGAEGPNELPQQGRRAIIRIVLDVFHEPMFLLLTVASLIYLTIGDFGEGLLLLGFAVVNIAIAVFQEHKTERVLEALKDLTSPRALVIREGIQRRIPGRELVRGDLLVLNEGDRVPGDAVLLSCTGLEADESLLTGESIPVRKAVGSGTKEVARPGGDDLPFVYSGTLIVKGHGLGEVKFTGPQTQIGRIGKSLGEMRDEPTLLHVQTRQLVKAIAIVAVVLCLGIFGLYLAYRGTWLDGLLGAITVAMSLLPQEFPLVLTVFLVMGAWRIAKRRVLTRRSSAIEVLGAATVLCTDKTGTLTVNRMRVAALSVEGALHEIDYDREPHLPDQFHRLVEYAILAGARSPFDPMEKAFLELGQHYLAKTEHLHANWVLAHEYTLSSDMLAMSQVWKSEDQEEFIVAAKGAPEAIADLCHLNDDQCRQCLEAARAMAERGLRVLAVAKATYSGREATKAITCARSRAWRHRKDGLCSNAGRKIEVFGRRGCLVRLLRRWRLQNSHRRKTQARARSYARYQ